MGEAPHRKRCRRYDVPGQAHCLTFSCFSRRAFLSRERACRWLIEAIRQARTREPFDLWAYVFMPEHVHLVIRPATDVSVSRELYQIKKPVTTWSPAWLRGRGPAALRPLEDRRPDGSVSHRFWQRGGGYDRNLRSADELHEKIRYVHANPVRRGLAAHPRDWLWSSWRAWHEGVDEPLPVDRETLPPLQR